VQHVRQEKRDHTGRDHANNTAPSRHGGVAFPDGSIGASALPSEWKRGNLRIETIANKQFTTLHRRG
jgi:hypothetical protein